MASEPTHTGERVGGREPSTDASARWERWGRALLELAALDKGDFPRALERILRVDASLLEVERVSFWSLHDEPELAIECEGMYVRSEDRCTKGQRLLATQFPRYFQALAAGPVVIANDARHDPRTCAFTCSYLEPAGIESMMDVPVWANGMLAGVLCHEHVGSPRTWTADESRFAVAVGHVVSMASEQRVLRERFGADRDACRGEEQLRALVEGVRRHAIFMLSPEGRVRTWNAGARTVYGWKSDEICDRPFSMFYPSDAVARGEPEKDLARAAKEGSVEGEGWRRARDGTRFWADVVLTAIRNERGELTGFADVVRDVTARRSMSFLGDVSLVLMSSLDYEQALRAAARRIVPFLADWCAIDLFESDGDPCTQRVAVAHIASEKEPALATLVERCPPPLHAVHPLASALRDGHARLFSPLDDAELERVCAEREHAGAIRALGTTSMMMIPLKGPETVLGVLTLAALADRRLYGPKDLAVAEAVAARIAYAVVNGRAYRRSQDATHAREEFLSIASHELRTPLTPLRLELDSARRYVAAHQSDPTLERKIESAHRQVDRLTGLVDRLLDVSRLVSGKLTLDLEPLELGALVTEVVQELESAAKAQGAPIRLILRAEAPGDWDRARIEQVVTNLLSNAVKYGQGRPIGAIVETRGESAVLVVHDRGIGIEPRDLRRIFDRFERAVSPHEYGGLGLGLYVARQIVEAHGGRIWATSEPGQGATFVVELPLAKRPAASASAPVH